jgi:energy-coupling factor transport system substrate-specific component
MQLKGKWANLILLALLLFLSWLALLFSDNYLLVSMGYVILAFIFIMVRFEKRKMGARELVLLAILAAIAAVGRIPFASIPSVQPTTFVIMMAGFAFGAESGFMIGVTAALASNMLLGQGPWTPWQMLAWGLVGFTAGGLSNTWFVKSLVGKIVFGVLWGFLFGFIMNIWSLLAFSLSGESLNSHSIITFLASSLLFDSFHSASNVICLLLFGEAWLKILSRFKLKYGLLNE